MTAQMSRNGGMIINGRNGAERNTVTGTLTRAGRSSPPWRHHWVTENSNIDRSYTVALCCHLTHNSLDPHCASNRILTPQNIEDRLLEVKADEPSHGQKLALHNLLLPDVGSSDMHPSLDNIKARCGLHVRGRDWLEPIDPDMGAQFGLGVDLLAGLHRTHLEEELAHVFEYLPPDQPNTLEKLRLIIQPIQANAMTMLIRGRVQERHDTPVGAEVWWALRSLEEGPPLAIAVTQSSNGDLHCFVIHSGATLPQILRRYRPHAL